MSQYFSNLKHDMLNYPQNPNFTNQNACRLCKQVFSNTQSLITHIESHRAHKDFSIIRTNTLNSPNYNIIPHRHLVSSLFPHTFPITKPLLGTRNVANNNYNFQALSSSSLQSVQMPLLRRDSFFSGSSSQVCPLTPAKRMKLSPLVYSYVRNNNAAKIAPLSIPQSYKRKLEELYPQDGTRDFIVQLEKPIKKIDFIDLVNIDDDNVKSLNLALKL